MTNGDLWTTHTVPVHMVTDWIDMLCIHHHSHCTLHLANLLQYHKSTKSTRSLASHLLPVPQHNLSFGSHAFRISSPKIWNFLHPHILQSQTLDSVRHHLKTYYFQSAYPAPYAPIPNVPRFSSETLALYKSLTYLLTQQWRQITCISLPHNYGNLDV